MRDFVELPQGDERGLAVVGSKAYLITQNFQLKEVLLPVAFLRASWLNYAEGALQSDLNEVDHASKAILCILTREHLSETSKSLLKYFGLFLAEVDPLALQWVRLPERAF